MKSWLYGEKKRSILLQALFLFCVGFVLFTLFSQLQENLKRQNIASGFGFLFQNAGFEISETFIPYSSDDTYLKALGIGILNTIKVAIIGNIFTLILGFLFGILSFSENFLLRFICRSYVHLFRNTPLLLQLFFWYSLFNQGLPSVREAYEVLPFVFLSNRGLFFPWSDVLYFCFIALFLILVLWFFLRRWATSYKERTSKKFPLHSLLGGAFVLLVLLFWFFVSQSQSFSWSLPQLEGFNFEGGSSLSPELSALLLGLILYTGAFTGEIVRSGLEAVDQGQWEAGRSLGLSRVNILRLLIIPQGLRVIVPPLTSQFLNLTKNSSLAVAIAYPDFVNVANTTLNQTGQAVELILLIMLVYFVFNIITASFMGWYNRKIQLVEK